MSMPVTYTYQPGSGITRDRIRQMIPDRVNIQRTPPAVFNDQEIAQFFTEFGDVLLAAAGACEVIAMDEAKRQLSVSISSGMSISRSSNASVWLQRAKQMREAAGKVPWEFIDEAVVDYTVYGEDNSSYIGDPEEDV